MTPEAQRIAIAEACGWKWYSRPASGPWAANPHRALYHPILSAELVSTLQPATMTERQCNDLFIWREGFIPDYLNDLNAAIQLCDELAGKGWNCELNNGLDKTWECEFVKHSDESNATIGERSKRHYGAADKLSAAICDAFLKTIGKWVD